MGTTMRWPLRFLRQPSGDSFIENAEGCFFEYDPRTHECSVTLGERLQIVRRLDRVFTKLGPTDRQIMFKERPQNYGGYEQRDISEFWGGMTWDRLKRQEYFVCSRIHIPPAYGPPKCHINIDDIDCAFRNNVHFVFDEVVSTVTTFDDERRQLKAFLYEMDNITHITRDTARMRDEARRRLALIPELMLAVGMGGHDRLGAYSPLLHLQRAELLGPYFIGSRPRDRV